MPYDDATVRWYKKHRWESRWVKDLSGKRMISIFFPPEGRREIADEMADDPPKAASKVSKKVPETPWTWLSMLTAYEHLRASEPIVERQRGFTLEKFLDRFFADWAQASAILGTMAHHDQTEVMKHFEIERLHAGTRIAIQRARADYLAAQAAREPDPLAQV